MKYGGSSLQACQRQHDMTGHGEGGFTLLEFLVVITILALCAAAVVPAISSADQARVALVAEKVAAALRFTRSEALRTGIAHGIIIDHDDSEATGKDIVVYQVGSSGSPFSIDHVVSQPITRQPYDISLVDASEKLSIVIRNSSPVFAFDGVGNSRHLHFDPEGRPVHYKDGRAHRLLSGTIKVGADSSERTVTLSSLTGQVSVR